MQALVLNKNLNLQQTVRRSMLIILCYTCTLYALTLCRVITQATAAPTVTVGVNPKVGTVEDLFTLTVKTSGSSQQTGKPRLNHSDIFKIVGTTSNSQISIINGVTSSSMSYSFQLAPDLALAPGKYQTPSGVIEVGGAEVEIPRSEITINPTTNPGSKQQSGGANQPSDPKDSPATNQVTPGSSLRQDADIKRPFVGQQIIATTTLSTAAALSNIEITDPNFPGFWREELGQDGQETNTDHLTGVTEIKVHDALFPLKAGALRILSRTISAREQVRRKARLPNPWNFDPFADDPFDLFATTQIVPRRIISNPVDLEVRPLPPAPKQTPYVPVGMLRLASSITRSDAQVGETITYVLELFGDANLRPLEINSLPVNETEFSVYAEKPQIERFYENGRVFFKKKFTFSIVPLQPGQLKINPLEILIFDPFKERYETIKTPERSINVTGSAIAALTPAPGKTNQTEAPGDSEPMQTPQDEIKVPQAPTIAALEAPLLQAPWYARAPLSSNLALFFTVLLLASSYALSRFYAAHAALEADPHLGQRLHALGNFKKALASINRTEALNVRELIDQFKLFLQQRFAISAQSMTPNEVVAQLEALSVNSDLTSRTKQFLLELEALQFSKLHAPAVNIQQTAETLASELDRV
ncbi:BatD family protein [bacterium]|nr:BatD family protein [bacterium]